MQRPVVPRAGRAPGPGTLRADRRPRPLGPLATGRRHGHPAGLQPPVGREHGAATGGRPGLLPPRVRGTDDDRLQCGFVRPQRLPAAMAPRGEYGFLCLHATRPAREGPPGEPLPLAEPRRRRGDRFPHRRRLHLLGQGPARAHRGGPGRHARGHRAHHVFLRRRRPRRRANQGPDRVAPGPPQQLSRRAARLLSSPRLLRRGGPRAEPSAGRRGRTPAPRHRLLRRRAPDQGGHAPGREPTRPGRRDPEGPPSRRGARRRRRPRAGLERRPLQPVPRHLRRHVPAGSQRRRDRRTRGGRRRGRPPHHRDDAASPSHRSPARSAPHRPLQPIPAGLRRLRRPRIVQAARAVRARGRARRDCAEPDDRSAGQERRVPPAALQGFDPAPGRGGSCT